MTTATAAAVVSAADPTAIAVETAAVSSSSSYSCSAAVEIAEASVVVSAAATADAAVPATTTATAPAAATRPRFPKRCGPNSACGCLPRKPRCMQRGLSQLRQPLLLVSSSIFRMQRRLQNEAFRQRCQVHFQSYNPLFLFRVLQAVLDPQTKQFRRHRSP